MEPNAPQPGRIDTPTPLKNKINVGTNALRRNMSDTKANMENPVDSVAGKTVGLVTSQFSAADSQKRFGKALGQAHKIGRVPTQPKYRLSLTEGGILIGVSTSVDIIDQIAGYFSVIIIGEIVVIIVDLIYGILMTVYCRLRLKLPFAAHLPIYISILGAEFINFIPFVNAAWWADAWYIVHTIRAEDRATHKQLLQTIEQERQEEARQEWVRNYQEQAVQEQQGQDQDESEQAREEDTQETSEEESAGVGRISPPKLKTPQQNFNQNPSNPNEAGRFKPNNGIMK